jgi:GxxExxY protein
LIHEEIKMEVGFRADVIVAEKVIVELKSIDALADVHYKQVLTYLKLSGCKLGLLVNFNTPLIKDGIHRIVNNL